MNMQFDSARNFDSGKKISPRDANRPRRGSAAVWQARLIMLVMINIAQLWILAAPVDAALARHYSVLLPLAIVRNLFPDHAFDNSLVAAHLRPKHQHRLHAKSEPPAVAGG